MQQKAFLSKNMIKSIGYCVSLLLLVIGVHALLTVGMHRYVKGGGFDVWNEIREGRATADILVIGSSRALIDVDCQVISQITTQSCYNIGFDGMAVNMIWARLKMYLSHHPPARTAILAVGLTDLNVRNDLFRPFQFIPYLDEEDIYEQLVQMDPQFRLWRYVPLYGYMVFNDQLLNRAVKGLFNSGHEETGWGETLRVRGSLAVDRQWSNDFDKFMQENPKGKYFDVNPQALSYYDKIIRLCQDKGMRVVLIFPPAFYESVYRYAINSDVVFTAIKQMASQHDVAFYDYSQLPMTKETKYFYNSQHLNRQGAQVFSKILASDIIKIFDKSISYP